jgi:hypothetical protein
VVNREEVRSIKSQQTICVWAAIVSGTLTACLGDSSGPTLTEPSSDTLQALSTSTSPVVFIGAGDIAMCSLSHDEATANLLDNVSGTVFTLGDNAYPDGTSSNYMNCYGPSWGRHKWRTRPAPGNHDYHVPNAAGYFGYFGSKAGPSGRGYYGYWLGSWRIYSLNSEANLSAQATWLKSDLAAHPAQCVLAYWYKPVFSSGAHGPVAAMRPLFTVLYNAGAEVVLGGHDHDYERFYPQTPSGSANWTRRITQFVVGTGGASLRAFQTPLPNSQVRHNGRYGVLKLTLYDGYYTWHFLSEAGRTFTDPGRRPCH